MTRGMAGSNRSRHAAFSFMLISVALCLCSGCLDTSETGTAQPVPFNLSGDPTGGNPGGPTPGGGGDGDGGQTTDGIGGDTQTGTDGAEGPGGGAGDTGTNGDFDTDADVGTDGDVDTDGDTGTDGGDGEDGDEPPSDDTPTVILTASPTTVSADDLVYLTCLVTNPESPAAFAYDFFSSIGGGEIVHEDPANLTASAWIPPGLLFINYQCQATNAAGTGELSNIVTVNIVGD